MDMIRKLQYKFVAISTAAIMIVMAALLILVNQMFYQNAVSEMFRALELIAENDGVIPEQYGSRKLRGYDNAIEFRYQLQYFSAWVKEDNTTVDKVQLHNIPSVSEDDAENYARQVLAEGKERGRIKGNNASFCYLISDKDNMKLVVFMDYSRDLHAVEELNRFSFWFSLVCLGFFIVVVSFLSRRALKPVIRNMENQKQFITNAGHELKTPLAIISANTEVLEMMEGENEWTRSTMNQVHRLTGLVNNLITLAKMGEQQEESSSDIDFSSCVESVVSDFRTIAGQNHIKLEKNIITCLKVKGIESHMKELVNILCDNAVKYCDEEGTVTVELAKRSIGKGIVLIVSNTYSDGEAVDYSRFFDRFYREDASRSNEKAGYGIGLAMAEGFAEECKGKISVSYKDKVITFRVILP